MNRRGFLQSCLALGAAPAVVRADSLMRIVPMDAAFPARVDVLYGWSAKDGNIVLTIDAIRAEALRILEGSSLYAGSSFDYRDGNANDRILVRRPRTLQP